MLKNEILEKSRITGMDEREKSIEKSSFNFGLITVLGMVLFFGIWNLLHGVKSYEFIPIFAGYLTTTSFYKFKKFKTNKYLVSGILGLIGVIAGTIAFILGA